MQEEVATIYSAIGNRCYKNLSCAEYDARSVCFSPPFIQSQRHPQHTILDGSLGITVLAFNTVRGTLLRGPHDSYPRGPSPGVANAPFDDDLDLT